jgi:hypothetical protein
MSRRNREGRDKSIGIERAITETESARSDRDAAQVEADTIGLTMPSAALQKLDDDAIARKEEESKPERGGCGRSDKSRCLAAEREAADYLRQLGRAKAKEEALQRADAAQKRLNVANAAAGIGPADAAALATLMAMQTGGSAQDYAAGMDIGEPIAMVVGMLLFASLIHPSLVAMKEGIGLDVGTEPPPKRMEVVLPPAKPALVERAAGRQL